MNIQFEPMGMQHQQGVMAVFNHYATTSTAAFPGKAVPEAFFMMLLKRTEGGYPAYALVDADSGAVAGFCQLSAYNPFSTFAKTASLTYFIAPAYVGRGLGTQCLARLETDARAMGIAHLVADVSSRNEESLAFHQKHGFTRVGQLRDIGEKLGQTFGVVLFQKDI